MQVSFNLSDSFQKKEFIRTLAPVAKEIKGEVVVTTEQAAILLEAIPYQVSVNTNTADFTRNTAYYAETLDIQEAFNGLIAYLGKTLEKKKAEKHLAEQEKQERIGKALKGLEDFSKGVQSTIYTFQSSWAISPNDLVKPQSSTWSIEKIIEDSFSFLGNVPEELIQAVKQEITRRKSVQSQLDEEEKQKVATRKAAEEAGKETLRAWALSHGSELLRLRIEEQMNWLELAQEEYALANMPEGFELDAYDKVDAKEKDWYEIKNPSLEQLKKLREIKNNHPSARLLRYKFVYEGLYEDEETVQHKDYIEVKIDLPTGGNRLVTLFLNDYPNE